MHHNIETSGIRRVVARCAAICLVLGCAVLAGGCGAKSGSDSAPEKVPPGVKSMQEFVKQQAATQKGAMLRQQRPGPRQK
jgi:hypothetical protein